MSARPVVGERITRKEIEKALLAEIKQFCETVQALRNEEAQIAGIGRLLEVLSPDRARQLRKCADAIGKAAKQADAIAAQIKGGTQ